jgi:predicted metal-dependent hydrolase
MDIEVRPLRFAIDASVPRYWHGGRRSVTMFFDNLSVFFGAGAPGAHDERQRDALDAGRMGFLFVEPGAMWRVIRRYWRYFRPGFHPNDIDSRSVIDAWRRQYDAAS